MSAVTVYPLWLIDLCTKLFGQLKVRGPFRKRCLRRRPPRARRRRKEVREGEDLNREPNGRRGRRLVLKVGFVKVLQIKVLEHRSTA